MAAAMKMRRLEKTVAHSLFKHLLYDFTLEGRKGCARWAAHLGGLITERELRNLLMAHCATQISAANRVSEPSSETYVSEDLERCFDVAIFGRRAILHRRDKECDRIYEIFRQIEAVLLRDLEVRNLLRCWNQYSYYINCIYEAAVETRSAQTVAEVLVELERRHLGLSGSPGWKARLPVARRILELVADVGPGPWEVAV